MSCDTNVCKLLVRWASNTYIRCLLPQLLWCMPLHVMFPLPTTSLHLVRHAPCCMYSVLYVCSKQSGLRGGMHDSAPGNHPGYCRACPCADNPLKKPFVCSYVFLAVSRNAPTCACPWCARVRPETHCACTCPMRHARCFRWLLLRYVWKYSHYTPWPFSLLSIPRLFVCLRMRMSTSKQYANVYVNQYSRSEIHCGSAVRFGQALPGFFITAPPSVCVSAFLGALAVWIRNQKKKKVKQTKSDWCGFKHNKKIKT